jgi:hypothetical protein
LGDDLVADGIDPTVKGMEGALRDPPLDRAAPDTRSEQLPPRDKSVLPLRQLGNDPIHITSAAFATYGVVNAALVPHETNADRPELTDCAPSARKEAPTRRYRLWL